MADPLDKEIQKLYDEWLSKPSPAVCSRLADQLRQSGRCDESIEVASDGLEQWADNISISVVLARSFKDSGKLSEASAIFERVRAADPLNLIALRNLAEIAFEQEQWARCAELFEEYIFEYPGDSESTSMLEQAKYRMKSATGDTGEDSGATVASVFAADGDTAAGGPGATAGSTYYPDTERMKEVLEAQGITSGAPPPTPDPPVDPAETDRGTAPPRVASSIPAGVREPRSLFDLFSEEERAELHLEDYRETGE